jgi:hypothetical protein
MNKLNALRAFLIQYAPELKRNPDKLHISATRGNLESWLTAPLSYGYSYDASILVEDFAGSPDEIFLPILLWLRTNEVALVQSMTGGASPISFQVDQIDDKSIDLAITLPLTEAVGVELQDGGYKLERRPEPPQIDTVLQIDIPDVPGLLQQLFGNDDQLLPDGA